jgi:2,4-diketo-3-deoxy-L-fuconate hydrolase
MHLCRFENNRLGLVEDDQVFDVSEALKLLPPPGWPYPSGDPLIIHLDRIKEAARQARRRAGSKPVSQVALYSLITSPTKLMAAPANYALHVQIDAQDPAVHHGLHNKQLEGVERPVKNLGYSSKRLPQSSGRLMGSRSSGQIAATITKSSWLS